MPTRYPYQTTIRNEYLGISKVIRAMNPNELDWLVKAQLGKWHQQEQRKRQQKHKEAERAAVKQETEDLRLRAEEETRETQQNINAFQKLLLDSVSTDLSINWAQLLDQQVFPLFEFNFSKPDRDRIRFQLLGSDPKERFVFPPATEGPSVFEIFLPFLRRRRLERLEGTQAEYEAEKRRAKTEFATQMSLRRSKEKEVVEAYNQAVHEYNAQLQRAKEHYVKERGEFVTHQANHNNAILALQTRFEAGNGEAIERYVQMVLEKSSYPEGIAGDPDVQFDEHSKTLVINFWLPTLEGIPKIVEYKYVVSRKAVKPVEMKQKEFEAFYESTVHQIALRTIHEVFTADYMRGIEAIVFNGWVRGIDGKTGKPFTSCILSCEASHSQFAEIDLAHVLPKECVRALKGITAGPLAMLAPVKPIMDLRNGGGMTRTWHGVGTLIPPDFAREG